MNTAGLEGVAGPAILGFDNLEWDIPEQVFESRVNADVVVLKRVCASGFGNLS